MTCDYLSLAAAEADGWNATNLNLTTGDEYITCTVKCTGGTADGVVTINGLSGMDADHYLRIVVDSGSRWTNTTYQNTKARIEGSDAVLMTISDEFVYVDGMQFGVTVTADNNGYGIRVVTIGASNAFRISNCVFKALSMAGTGSSYGFVCDDADANLTFWNCVAYGFVSGTDSAFAGFRVPAAVTANFYNCVAYGNRSGFYVGVGTYSHCVSCNNNDDFNGTFTLSYCAEDDNDAHTGRVDISPNADEAADHALAFLSPSTGDFHLKDTDSLLYHAGSTDPSGGLCTVDIDGDSYDATTRSIGADEYVAAGGPAFFGTEIPRGTQRGMSRGMTRIL